MPAPVVILWQKLRLRQLRVKFRRQYALANRIFDFYSPEAKLAIEVDGDSHFTNQNSRTKELFKDEAIKKQNNIKV